MSRKKKIFWVFPDICPLGNIAQLNLPETGDINKLLGRKVDFQGESQCFIWVRKDYRRNKELSVGSNIRANVVEETKAMGYKTLMIPAVSDAEGFYDKALGQLKEEEICDFRKVPYRLRKLLNMIITPC